METISAFFLGVISSLVAAAIAYIVSQIYQNHKVLRKFDFLKSISGTWYGLHYTNRGKTQHVSQHEYKLFLTGSTIKGTRKELGLVGEPFADDPTIYSLEGKMHEGVLVLHEISGETREVATTLITNFAQKGIFRGVYASTADLNGSPIASPIIITKDQQPSLEKLQEYRDLFVWCALANGCA